MPQCEFFAFVPVSALFHMEAIVADRPQPIGIVQLYRAGADGEPLPIASPHHTLMLAAIHLPIVVLFLLLYFYGGPSQGKELAS